MKSLNYSYIKAHHKIQIDRAMKEFLAKGGKIIKVDYVEPDEQPAKERVFLKG